MTDERPAPTGNRKPLLVAVWAWVGLPFAYGVYELVQTATKLFGG